MKGKSGMPKICTDPQWVQPNYGGELQLHSLALEQET